MAAKDAQRILQAYQSRAMERDPITDMACGLLEAL
jgi:hypothetical protein